ncbi:NACHT domain-containing protein [Streptomyces albiaxialis]|uniref:NACHT domain-containing protein n=1 Tax=Streptomyces albiaxialis TaxID=329523 RepID=A0ABP5IRA8_9ACTN
MEPTTVAARLASSAVTPLVKRLFVQEGPGAGLTDRPVRIASRVSFRGERRTLTERDLHKLAAELVRRAAEAGGPHEAPDPATRDEVTEALASALHSLGDLDMDDVQAVRLGADGLAALLARRDGSRDGPVASAGSASDRTDGLSEAAEACFRPLLRTACVHILHFFTQRSTFVARTLVEQTRTLEQVVATTDLLAARIPSQTARDARFEQRYADHIARKHGELTIYGLDLRHAREWRLDSAYVSLEATASDGQEGLTAPLPAERALSGQERVLLRGGAGSGKTTLVQWLAVTAARQDALPPSLSHLVGRVPFVLPLRRVGRDGLPPAPDRFLDAVRSSVAGEQPEGWAARVLRAGRGLLLVDGIDEIPEREREPVRRWMRELMGDYPGNLWLVTARPSAVREDWLEHEGFTELSLAPMARADVAEFVRRWHEAAGADPELGTSLLDAVRTAPALAQLAVNPLMCGLLCALHRERRGFLPQGRKDLYEAALSMLLERRDVERGVADGLRLSKETQIQLLQKLAHWLLRNDRAEMERADAVAQLERALVSMAHVTAGPEEVHRYLLERSGLLREPAEGRVDFVHRTFQDYLAAKAAVEEGDFPLLTDNASRDQWEDVVQMAVALGRPAERARILRALVGPAEFRPVMLAMACLKHAVELDPAVRDEVTGRARVFLPPPTVKDAIGMAETCGPLLIGLLPGPEGLTDDQAVRTVTCASHVATDAAITFLGRYCDHPSLAVRRQLAWRWHHFGTEEYGREIIARLDGTGLYFTAHSAAHLRVLRELGGRERIQFFGPHDPAELVGLIDPSRLTALWLTADVRSRDGWSWLDAFPRLRTLVVPEDTPAPDLDGIPAHVQVVTDAHVS